MRQLTALQKPVESLENHAGSDWFETKELLVLLNRGRLSKPTKYWVRKRICDLILSTVTTILSAPLLVLIAIMIKLDSRGPVIYRQERVGEGLRIFKIWKFRTMHVGSSTRPTAIVDEDSGKVRRPFFYEDPRVTRIGRILRKYSIDELPQLYNILTGQMSIVGPRPLMIEEGTAVEKLQLGRYSVPSGLTGLAQIKDRSLVFNPKRFDPDIEYIKEMSFKLDLQIILKTFRVLRQDR